MGNRSRVRRRPRTQTDRLIRRVDNLAETVAIAAGGQMLAMPTYTTEQSGQRQDARDTGQTGRQEARQDKADCSVVSPNCPPASVCVSRRSVTASTTFSRCSARCVNSIVSSAMGSPL